MSDKMIQKFAGRKVNELKTKADDHPHEAQQLFVTVMDMVGGMFESKNMDYNGEIDDAKEEVENLDMDKEEDVERFKEIVQEVLGDKL